MPEGADTTQEGGKDAPARLLVRLEGKRDAPPPELPVEVQTPFLLPVARGWTDEPIAVPAGEHVVSVRPPGCAPLTTVVRVAAGEERIVVLTPPAAAAPSSPVKKEHAERGGAGPASGRGPRRLGFAGPRSGLGGALGMAGGVQPAAEPPDDRPTVAFHLLTGNPLEGPLRGAGSPSAHVRFGGPGGAPELAGGGERAFAIVSCDADELVLAVRDPGLPARAFALLRIAEQAEGDGREDSVRFIAVPVAWDQPVRIRLQRASGDDALQVAIHPEDPMTDTLLHYRRAGQLEEARSLLDRHREAILGVDLDAVPPLRWAAMALLTLRLADPLESRSGPLYERLFRAADALDFPDLQAAAAEAAVRLGDMDRFRALAERATRQGLPYLSDALSLLHARILESARPPRPDPDMKRLYQRLAPLLGLVDLKAVLLTLRGGGEQLFRP